MQAFPLGMEKENEVWAILHDKVQAQLLTCYDRWVEVSTREAEIIRGVEDGGVPTQAEGRVANINTIQGLAPSAHAFLYAAKSALRDVKSMICAFFVESRRAKKRIEDGNYHNLKEWAEGRFGDADRLARLIGTNVEAWIDEVYAKRNAVEHPDGGSGVLHISNFTAVQDPETRQWLGVRPMWARNDEPASSITDDMQAIIDNILGFAEDMLALSLLKSESALPITICEIPQAKRDPNCPIRLSITIDQ
tara:strand:+ start:573 stop:1319 length:747 start_codon:yes stop_codon:yes gene_type:complete